MATGHYADLVFKKEKAYLRRSIDLNKDQTYFLHEVSSNEFKYCLFPLANLTKPEVREIAKSIQLPNRNKKDSVGICFVGERNMKDFLNRFIDFEAGPIIDDSNNVIGEHHGSLLYTIGQRQGLRIGGVKDMPDLPWYVFKKDQKNNSLYVCQGEDNPLLFSKGLSLERFHWITDEFSGQLECEVQVRHRHKAVKCILDVNELEVKFDEEYSDLVNLTGVSEIISYRCAMCHAKEPLWDGLFIPAGGLVLETEDDILKFCKQIYVLSAISHAMPPNNLSAMELEERLIIKKWYEKLNE